LEILIIDPGQPTSLKLQNNWIIMSSRIIRLYLIEEREQCGPLETLF
jgi:hypothetical protein